LTAGLSTVEFSPLGSINPQPDRLFMSRSSIYRFDGDSVFHTIGGFREVVEEAPTLIRWEKVKD
jgi:hypothetical protein